MPIGPYSPDTTPNQGGSLPSPVIPSAEGDQTVTPAVTGGPEPAATPGLKDRVLGTLNAFRSPQDPEASPSMPTPVIGETPAAPEPIVTALTPAPELVPTATPASPPQITTSPDTSPFGRATEQSTDRFGGTPAIEPMATPLTPGLAAAEPPPILPAFEPSSTPPDTTPAVEPADQGAEQNSADAAIAANEAEQAKILQPLTENTGEISAKWNLTPEQKQELADIARESFLQSLENLAGGTPEPKNTAASQATLADLGTSALDPSTNKPPNY